eukprot:TRINITY_DN7917_c0_g2_i1.p1 TRINITY_DN7917_c0_g2~~TRINITY_DN7917_c0_g2_i1.p1  ORF type:complete len:119 (-),score=28.98 TRINITY_DN7917_c0_g2_i1:29-355(-)
MCIRDRYQRRVHGEDSESDSEENERFNLDSDITKFIVEQIIPHTLEVYLGLIEDEDIYEGDGTESEDSNEHEGEHRHIRARGRNRTYKLPEDTENPYGTYLNLSLIHI